MVNFLVLPIIALLFLLNPAGASRTEALQYSVRKAKHPNSSAIRAEMSKASTDAKGKDLLLSEEDRETDLKPLLEEGWTQLQERDGIHREYQFKNFNEAFGFMTNVALKAEACNHHPEWSNTYNRVQVRNSFKFLLNIFHNLRFSIYVDHLDHT